MSVDMVRKFVEFLARKGGIRTERGFERSLILNLKNI